MTSASRAEADKAEAVLRAFPDRLARLSGWRRALAAFSAGALSALAMPPFSVWPAMFVTMPVLVWLLDGCAVGDRPSPMRRAALAGWCFGFGYFVIGLYWIGEAFLVEAGRHAWLLPLAITGLTGGLALFFGLAAAFAMTFWARGPTRILALALALGATEYARGHVLTGFPWNLLGSAITANDDLLQLASLIGVNALTFLAVILFASPAALVAPFHPRAARLGGAVPIGCALLGLGSAWLWGEHRLSTAESRTVEGVRLRVVQANISQKDKWAPANEPEILADYLRLTRDPSPPGKKATVVVWPETALPILLAQSPNALASISKTMPEGASLVAGSIRIEQDLDPHNRLLAERAFNSLVVIDRSAAIVDLYDKMHLVPFGEYLPAQELLESWGIFQLAGVRGGFAAGRGPKILSVPGAPPASPLICYEIIFTGDVTQPGRRPGWLINLTNDAWFGTSAGPYQHFHQARIRAVEQGLPVVRAANTGISAIIDPYGRIVASLGLDREGVIAAPLPRSLPPTVYARFGGWADAVVSLLIITLLFLSRLISRRSRALK